jgi:hypothetical protein
MNEEKFESWAIVNLFGHSRMAGKCSEQNIAGANMLRVDVPETNANPAFTRFYGASSIYSISPVTEDIAKVYAERLNEMPIESWDIHKYMEKVKLIKAKNDSNISEDDI